MEHLLHLLDGLIFEIEMTLKTQIDTFTCMLL